jgi:periplasmic protein TonB
MYYSNAAARQPRTMGVVTVVMFHVVLIAGLLAMKQPISVFIPPEISYVQPPEVVVPPEPPPPPVVPEDLNLTEPLPIETFQLPEIVPIEAVDPTPSIPRVADPVPTTATPGTGTPGPVADVRKSAVFPTRFEKPPYPSASERLGEEGFSTVEACVTAKGAVTSTRLVATSGYARLDEAAVKWMKQLRGFKPATLNGKPIDGCITTDVEWKIEKR